MPEFKIGKILVGNNYTRQVIAEIGIKYEASLDNAINMDDAEILAGAKITKHKTHIVQNGIFDMFVCSLFGAMLCQQHL